MRLLLLESYQRVPATRVPCYHLLRRGPVTLKIHQGVRLLYFRPSREFPGRGRRSIMRSCAVVGDCVKQGTI